MSKRVEGYPRGVVDMRFSEGISFGKDLGESSGIAYALSEGHIIKEVESKQISVINSNLSSFEIFFDYAEMDRNVKSVYRKEILHLIGEARLLLKQREWKKLYDKIQEVIRKLSPTIVFGVPVIKGEGVTEKMPEEVAEVTETKVPEGVTMVKFEFLAEVDAKVAEDMFEVMVANGAEFRSAVNMGTMVRTVMYPKGSKTGSPIRMVTKDKDTAWSLQQTIDWQYRDIIDVVAVKKEGLDIEVAYIKRGLKVPPPKEKMIYTFKKTDGWTLKGNEKYQK